ncbi:MAG TPA: hypothetical protein VGZ25_12135 [Gemmataceae bacterium]|nr:hypothetical protein [Gemmataceae bacterium]
MMQVVRGTYQKGQIVLDSAVDWPEGSRVLIEPANPEVGLRESDWPETPENIANLLARMDEFDPLELSPEEEREIEAAREEVRKVTIEAVKRQMGLEA